MYLRMLNAVSSGSRLANVTPVRSGGRRSNSCGSRTRLQPASPSATVSATRRAARRGVIPEAAPRRLHIGDATGGPGGEAPRGVAGWLSRSRTAGATGRRSRFSRAANTAGARLRRRADTDRLATAGSEDDMQTRRRVDLPLGDRNGQRVRQPVRAGPVGVDLGDVLPPGRKERERDVEAAALPYPARSGYRRCPA